MPAGPTYSACSPTPHDATASSALSDQLVADLADLARGGPGDSVVARSTTTMAIGLAGLAMASRHDGDWTMQVVRAPRHRDESVLRSLVTAAVGGVAARRGRSRSTGGCTSPTSPPTWSPTPRGLRADRDLLQMRRPSAAEQRPEVSTRSFRPGRDEAAWLAVNNRAFAGHHEQHGWTLDTVRQRMGQPWFDPDDLRLHERDGRLAAFCWTKIHPPPTTVELLAIQTVADVPNPPAARPSPPISTARSTSSASIPTSRVSGSGPSSRWPVSTTCGALASPRRCSTSTGRTRRRGRSTSASGSACTASIAPSSARSRQPLASVIGVSAAASAVVEELPRWSVTDLFESLDSREFRAALEQAVADTARAVATFDHHDVRAIEPRPATEDDGARPTRRSPRSTTSGAPQPPACLRVRDGEHGQPRRAGPVAVQRAQRHRLPHWRRCSPGSPTGSTPCTSAAADPTRWPPSARRRPTTPVRCCASPTRRPTR